MMYNRTPEGDRKREREREVGVVIVGGRRQEVAALSVLRDKTMSLELLPSQGRRVHMQESARGVWTEWQVPAQVRVLHRFNSMCASLQLDQVESVDTKVDDSQVWVPAEEPIVNLAFLFDSKIWEVCQELSIHWIHPVPLSGEGRGRRCLY